MIEIFTTPHFDKEYKALAKKYKSLPKDLQKLEQTLLEDPTHGTGLGDNTYKIRMAIKSKGKGKSAGARVISVVLVQQIEDITKVALITIYDKSEKESISNKRLLQLKKEAGL